MGRKKITLRLSTQSIDEAITDLERYKQDILKKTELLRDKVAERLAEEAKNGFSGAVVDDIVRGGSPRTAQVDVSVDNRGMVTVVVASGEDAVWVEFGAGVYHNSLPGTSPHPHGAQLGMVIGGFGKGNGKRQAWGYYDEDGGLTITRGTPAAMPMTRAVITVCNEISRIVKEVFG